MLAVFRQIIAPAPNIIGTILCLNFVLLFRIVSFGCEIVGREPAHRMLPC
jgi:hypothetical protein